MNLPFDPDCSLSFIQQMIVHGVVLLTETPTDFVVHENWTAYPDEPGEEVRRGHTEHHSAKERVAITSPLRGNWQTEYSYMEFPSVEVYKRYCQEEHDIDQGHNVFLTPVEYEKYLKKEEAKKLREERVRMESKCQEIMKKYKIECVDSVEFFEKVEELSEGENGEWNRKIEGLREDGLCIGFGVSVDQWCEEKNYMSGKREEACVSWGQLKDYLNEKFPIMAAEYRQSKKVAV